MSRGRLLPGLAVAVAVGLSLATGPAAIAADARLDVASTSTGPDRQVSAVVSAPRELAGVEVPPEAFTVFENGRPRRAEVRRLPSEGLDVVLVLDTSGSMTGGPLAAAKAAAVEFITQMPAGTRVAVVGFGATVRVASGFSADRRALAAAVNNLTARGETALYDALAATAAQLLAQAGPRRSVVVLSDGGDTVSRASLEAAAAGLVAARTEVFAVALATSESDGQVLARLAGEATRVVAADNPAALAGAYSAIASRLVNRYDVRFAAESGGPAEVRLVLDAGPVHAEAVRTVELPPLPPPPVPVAEPAVASAPGLLAGAWLLPLGGLIVAAALGLAGWVVLSREPRRRLAREYALSAVETSGRLAGVSGRASAAVDRALGRSGRDRSISRALDQAGIALRPGGFVVLALSCAWTAFAVGVLLAGLGAGLLLAVVTGAGFRLALSAMATRRRARFGDQMGDTVQLLAGSLRTGYGLIQAIDSVARESEAPTSEEFRRLVVEHRLGRDLAESLQALAVRMGNDDFDWVVQAINIHREIGGDLAEVLDNVGATIRDRNRVRRQVKALSAEGRLSAGVLFVLPFGVGGVIAITNPDYFGLLAARPGGRIMLGVAGSLMCLGGVWLRKLVRLVY